MWTKIDSTTFSYISSTDTTSTLSVGSFSYIDYSRWVTIDPFTYSCEIRNIIDIDPLTNRIVISPKLNNTHTNGTLYIQSSPTWDVSLFGSIPLGNLTYSYSMSTTASNIRTGINNAIYDCEINGGGIVYIPKGNYIVNKSPSIDGCIDLSGKSNIDIVGDGLGVSSIKLNSDNYSGANVSIFYAPNAQNIKFSNLTIDGNKSNVSGLGNNSNGIDSNLGQRFLIEDIEIVNSPFNGIKLSNFYNLNMKINNIKYSRLNGMLVTGQSSELKIVGNTFIENESNDLYFNSSTFPSINTNTITENIFIKYYVGTYSIYIDDTSGLNSINEYYVISNNEFNGNSIYFENCRNFILNNNLLVSGTTSNPPFETSKTIESFNVQGNVIVNRTSNQHAIKMSSYKYGDSSYAAPMDVFIGGNTLEGGDCYIKNGANVNFNNNKVKRNSVNADGFVYEISEDPTNYNLKNWGYLNLSNNQFIDITGNGISITCSNTNYKISNVLISDNIIQGLKNGVYITGSIAASFSGYNTLTITDIKSSRSWIPNMWTDYKLSIISGYGLTTSDWNTFGLPDASGQTFSILSNNNTRIITIDGTWSVIPGSYSVYQISKSSDIMKYGLIIATPSSGSGNFWDNLLVTNGNIISGSTYSSVNIYTDYLVNKTDYNETWIVLSNPEGRIDAPNFSVAIDKTRNFDNNYIKNGNTYKTGWVLRSELDKQIIINDNFGSQTMSNMAGYTPSYTVVNKPWIGNLGTWPLVENNGIIEAVPGMDMVSNIGSIILAFTSSNSKSDATVKALFRSPNYTNGQIGISFRFQDTSNYWSYRFAKYAPPATYSVFLEKLVGGVTYSVYSGNVSFDNNSNLFSLKANLKGDYISIYYNDFLLSTIKDSTFNTQTYYGLIAVSASSTDYFCQNFKILI